VLCVLSVHFLHSFHIKTRSLLYIWFQIWLFLFVVTCHLMCCMCNQFSSILTFLSLFLLYMRFHEYNLMLFVDYHRSIESLIRSTTTRFLPITLLYVSTSRFTFFIIIIIRLPLLFPMGSGSREIIRDRNVASRTDQIGREYLTNFL